MVQLLQSGKSGRKRGRKRAVWMAMGLFAAGGALWLAKDPIMQRYRFWKQDRALVQAKEFVAAKDALSAQLALDVALKSAPGNADTIRVAADILEQVGAAQSIRLRHAVTLLRPESSEDAARLILCALRFRDLNTAKEALATASPEISKEIPMMQAALAYAISTGDAPVADALLRALREKVPDSTELLQAHAILHLRHPSAEKRAEAERQLEKLAQDQPANATRIHRELAAAALGRQDYPEARKHIEKVLTFAGATLEDRLQKANVELLIDNRPFDAIYAELSPVSGGNVDDAVRLARWLLVQRRSAEAKRWIESLPAEFRKNREVLSVEAEMLSQAGEWDRLAPMIEAGVWGAIPAESVRLAMSARLVNAQQNHALRGEIWDAAMQASGGGLSALGVLHRLATLWSWNKEAESTLWLVARSYPDQTWAHQALFDAYKQRGNTAGMRDVLGALRQANGAVPRYQHDWALLTLLREPTPTWNSAKETMKDLHEKKPGNIVYATGYALALAQAERAEEALRILAAFPAEELEQAARLPYLAYVNGMARRAEEVARLTNLARASGTQYLPEEARLLELAVEAPARSLPKPKTRKEANAGAAAETKQAGETSTASSAANAP